MSRDEAGNCSGCGIAVSIHFDPSNRMRGCEWAAKQIRPVDRAKLFGLKLKKNFEARRQALASIRPIPGGMFQLRVGGPVRGKTIKVGSHAGAVRVVHEFYNEMMMAFIENRSVKK